MPDTREMKYTCPYCGKEFDITIYNSVYADVDSDLRDRAVSGDLFRFSCPHCKTEFLIQYPLVYYDQNHKFVIWLSKKEASKDLSALVNPLQQSGYILRRCETIEEFTEKIQILEDGISDVAVELAKFDSFIEYTENRGGKQEEITSIAYQHADDGVLKINIKANDKGMSFLIPMASLEEEMETHKQLFDVEEEKFPLINTGWIIDLFTQSSGQA